MLLRSSRINHLRTRAPRSGGQSPVSYACDASDASFELLARRMLGKMLQYFDVSQFDINVEQRVNAIGECG